MQRRVRDSFGQFTIQSVREPVVDPVVCNRLRPMLLDWRLELLLRLQRSGESVVSAMKGMFDGDAILLPRIDEDGFILVDGYSVHFFRNPEGAPHGPPSIPQRHE